MVVVMEKSLRSNLGEVCWVTCVALVWQWHNILLIKNVGILGGSLTTPRGVFSLRNHRMFQVPSSESTERRLTSEGWYQTWNNRSAGYVQSYHSLLNFCFWGESSLDLIGHPFIGLSGSPWYPQSSPPMPHFFSCQISSLFSFHISIVIEKLIIEMITLVSSDTSLHLKSFFSFVLCCPS